MSENSFLVNKYSRKRRIGLSGVLIGAKELPTNSVQMPYWHCIPGPKSTYAA